MCRCQVWVAENVFITGQLSGSAMVSYPALIFPNCLVAAILRKHKIFIHWTLAITNICGSLKLVNSYCHFGIIPHKRIGLWPSNNHSYYLNMFCLTLELVQLVWFRLGRILNQSPNMRLITANCPENTRINNWNNYKNWAFKLWPETDRECSDDYLHQTHTDIALGGAWKQECLLGSLWWG